MYILKDLFYFYLYVWMWTLYVCPWRPEEGVLSPGAGVTGSCQPLDVGNGSQVKFQSGPLARAVCVFNCWALPSSLLWFTYLFFPRQSHYVALAVWPSLCRVGWPRTHKASTSAFASQVMELKASATREEKEMEGHAVCRQWWCACGQFIFLFLNIRNACIGVYKKMKFKPQHAWNPLILIQKLFISEPPCAHT